MSDHECPFASKCALPIGILLLVVLCLSGVRAIADLAEPPGRTFTILAINDVYRIEGVDERQKGGIARLRSLRTALEQQAPDLLVLHAGDMLFPSLLSRQYNGEQMIDVLNLLDGNAYAFDPRMLVTFGNHEFDQDARQYASMLQHHIAGSQFRWLASNIEFDSGDDGRLLVEADNLLDRVIINSGGVRVGLFSLTIKPDKLPEYVTYIGAPQAAARIMTAELRKQGAEVVVALTHLRMAQDVEILRKLGPDGPDLIIGGHEHNKQSRQVYGRWVIKADADARTATVVHVTTGASGPPHVQYEFYPLGPNVREDALVKNRVQSWLDRHDREYCEQTLKLKPGCLGEKLGKTRVTLIGEELELRRYETNLGNWVVDQARAAFADRNAQVAFINSGSLRLNQDIPAGSDLTRRHVAELFAYPAPLKLLRIKGQLLQQVISHAVEDWTGNGWWLQISGFAFRHDPRSGTADSLMLITPDGKKRPIKPEEEILAVTTNFLVKPKTGQDGYTMLSPQHMLPHGGDALELRDLVIKALQASGEQGIAPAVEGRICNTQRAKEPCLAVTAGDQ